MGQTILPNGVRVVTDRMSGARTVSLGVWVDIGSRDEGPDQAGVTHFLEHAVFRGTSTRNAAGVSALTDQLGGDVNAFTDKEHTCFHSRTLADDTVPALDLLVDLVGHATLLDHDLEAVRPVLAHEIGMYLDTPDVRTHLAWAESFFGDHPLSRASMGTRAGIEAVGTDVIRSWYQQNYASSNLVVTAAGAVDHNEFCDLVGQLTANIRRGGSRPERRPPGDYLRPAMALVPCRTEQVHVVLGTSWPPRGDPFRLTAAVIAECLGGGVGSRLHQTVRERAGLAYSVYSYQGVASDHGTLEMYAGTSPDRVEQTIDALIEEVRRLRKEGLSVDEFGRQRRHLSRSLSMTLETPHSRIHRLGRMALANAPLRTVEDLLIDVDRLDVDEANVHVGNLLAGPFALAVLGPIDGIVDQLAERFGDMRAVL